MINQPNRSKVLMLGVTGMLGHALFMKLSEDPSLDVYAGARSLEGLAKWVPQPLLKKIKGEVNAIEIDSIVRLIAEVRPDIVINCIGIIKQSPAAKDPLTSIQINSLFPHQLANICGTARCRLIHISTDCVFDGMKGDYAEDDNSNATDLYGRTKFLGEVTYPHCLTMRTSIIGHEIKSRFGLLEWFLAEEGQTKGYTNVIFSGFPIVEIAQIISTYAIPNPDLHGLYQVSAEPISKYDLLGLIADRYQKRIEIEPYEDFRLDRSLDSTRFREVTGYRPPPWSELVNNMYQDFINHSSRGKIDVTF